MKFVFAVRNRTWFDTDIDALHQRRRKTCFIYFEPFYIHLLNTSREITHTRRQCLEHAVRMSAVWWHHLFCLTGMPCWSSDAGVCLTNIYWNPEFPLTLEEFRIQTELTSYVDWSFAMFCLTFHPWDANVVSVTLYKSPQTHLKLFVI